MSVPMMPVPGLKVELRQAALLARRALPAATRSAWDAALTTAAVDLARGHPVVAAYVPLGDEPGGPALVPALAAVVQTLLLPMLLADHDLAWVPFTGELAPGRRGIQHPPGASLGVTAIADASLVLVPALGVDATGVRLGRGGGSYDRALHRVALGTPVVALLYADEVHATLPAQPHDRAVTAALTPTGLVTLAPPR